MAYLLVIFDVGDDPKTVDPMDAADSAAMDARIVDAMWDPIREERLFPRRKRWVTEYQEYFPD